MKRAALAAFLLLGGWSWAHCAAAPVAVDFVNASRATRFPAFARWMAANHVRMQAHLRPVLRESFIPLTDEICPAYGGMWEYLQFVGRRRS